MLLGLPWRLILAAFCSTLAMASTTAAQTTPTITVSPKTLPPSANMTVKGAGFTPFESVGISLDTSSLQQVKSNGRGGWAPVSIEVPPATLPGTHTLIGTGQQSGAKAQASILVRTDSPVVGFTPQRVHYNPYEDILNNLNVATLKVLWNVPAGSWVRASPVVAGGIVYIGSASKSLFAFNANTGRKIWSAPTGGNVTSSAAVSGGTVYVGSDDFKLYAFNATTGAQLWSAPTHWTVSSSPIVGNGIVYVASGDNTLYAFNTTTGALMWSQSIGVPPAGSGTDGPPLGNGETLSAATSRSSPSIANNVVYVGSGDHNVYAFDATTGAKLWAAPTGDWVNASPTIANGVVYVGSWDMNFYAFDATSGAKLWSTPLNEVVPSSAAVANGVIYVGSADGRLYSLDAATGAILWSSPTKNAIASSPTVANGVVYIGSFDNSIYAFDAGTGAKLWSYATPFFVEGSPAVANGVLFIGSMAQGKNVYAFSVNGVLPPAAFQAAAKSADESVQDLGPLAR